MKSVHPRVPASLRDLTPESARLCLGIERFCLEELGLALRDAGIVLGFSGGADSLALLSCLRVLSARHGVRLTVAILDHCLRPEAVDEVRRAGELAADLGLDFATERVDVGRLAAECGIGHEEAGRNARFAFLERVRQARSARYIALGHQLNDLAEDALMRLMRGAVWPALAGMEGVDWSRHLIRPLLLTPRAALEAFLCSFGASWILDPLNTDARYLRNRVRERMVPLFLAENPAFLEHVARRWRIARLDAGYLEEQLEASLKLVTPCASPQGRHIGKALLCGLHPALRLRLYKALLDAAGPGQVRAGTLLELEAAWRRGEGGKELRFHGGKRARIHQGGVLIYRETEPGR